MVWFWHLAEPAQDNTEHGYVPPRPARCPITTTLSCCSPPLPYARQRTSTPPSNDAACVTVTETDKPPQWMYTLDDETRLELVLNSDEAVTRRQGAAATYVLNGAVYVVRTDWLRKTRNFVTDQTRAHVMPEARSADVDTALDLAWCEFAKTKGPYLVDFAA